MVDGNGAEVDQEVSAVIALNLSAPRGELQFVLVDAVGHQTREAQIARLRARRRRRHDIHDMIGRAIRQGPGQEVVEVLPIIFLRVKEPHG